MYRKDLRESIDSVINFDALYDKTFLITGAAGLIASFLIDLLFYANETMDAGIRVYALVRNQAYVCVLSTLINSADGAGIPIVSALLGFIAASCS